ALAHGTVVAPRGSDRDRRDSGELGRPGEHDDDRDERRPEAGDERERQVEGGVRKYVAELVEQAAEGALLAVLAGEHAVDRVERHAGEERGGQEQEEPSRSRPPSDRRADREREDDGRDRDLVRGDSDPCESTAERAEQALERGLEIVDARHGTSLDRRGWRESYRAPESA